METWNARSSENLGVNRKQGGAFSERLLGGRRLGLGGRAFSDAFGDIVLQMTKDVILNAPNVVRSLDADLSRAADRRLPAGPDNAKSRSGEEDDDARVLPDPDRTKSRSGEEDDVRVLPNPDKAKSTAGQEEDYEAAQTASAGPVYMDSEPREVVRKGTAENAGSRPNASATQNAGNAGSMPSQDALGNLIADSESTTDGGAAKDPLMRADKAGMEPAFQNLQNAANVLSSTSWQTGVQSNLALVPAGVLLADNILPPEGLAAASNLANATIPVTPSVGDLVQVLPGQSVPSAPAYGPTLGYEELSNRIIQGVRIAQHAESTEVFVRLKPDFLGRLSIRVLSDDHGMRIDIKAENEAVRQVMQDNLANLQQRLAEKGLAFNQFNILADAGSRSWQESQWPEAAFASDRESDPAGSVEAPLLLTRSGIIDYLA